MFDNGIHPIDALRDRISNWRAHPFQNIASGLLGAVVPGGGLLAGRGFDLYNQHQFNDATQTNASRTADQMGMDTNDAMNKPLNGALGQFDNLGTGGGNEALANALAGGGGGGGGYQGGNYGSNQGWNQAQNWQNPSGFTGGSSVVQGILDQLPGGSNFSNGPMSHQDHLDAISNKQNQGNGPGANYGVSPFMVGGSPVIFGSGDPNGKYHKYMQNMGG